MNQTMNIDVLNRACRDLPDGYAINITLTKGCGSAALVDDDCELADLYSWEGTFEAGIDLLVKIAREDAEDAEDMEDAP